MKIQVSDSDIACGIRGRTNCCPVALAAARSFGSNADIDVLEAEMRVTADGVSATYDLSERAARFIQRFDSERPVEPLTITAVYRG